MTKRAIMLPLAGLALFAAASLLARVQNQQEQPDSLDKLPPAVKATVLRETAGGQIEEIESEIKDGQTIYEVEFVRDGQKIELRISADGTVFGRETHAEKKGQPREQERQVTEAEVPAVAQAALKKLAGGAKITAYSEEIKNGTKFYEGSWKTSSGLNVDAVVTAAGDLVELEEQVPPEQVPASVLAAVRKLAGDGGALFCEKKTMILYEVKFRKDGQRHEILYSPDGSVLEKEVENAPNAADDKDD